MFVIRKIVGEQSRQECDVIDEMRAMSWFELWLAFVRVGACTILTDAVMNCGSWMFRLLKSDNTRRQLSVQLRCDSCLG